MCANPMVPFAHTLCFNAAIKLEDNLVGKFRPFFLASIAELLQSRADFIFVVPM